MSGRVNPLRQHLAPRCAPKAKAEMGRLPAVGVLSFLAASCAVGPSFRQPDPGAPRGWRPATAVADSLRPFYDSLRAHRDTLPLVPRAPAPSADTARQARAL